MKKNKIKITESQLRKVIKESLIRMLYETNRIRPFTDDDYRKVNPYQENHGLEDFARWKEMDDEYKRKYKTKINYAHSRFGNQFISDPTKRLQGDLTDKIRARKKERTGCENIMPSDFIRKIPSELQKKLESIGLDFHLNGKTFAYGNAKLPENILICNITSSFQCPSALRGECKLSRSCYSKRKVETRPNVLSRNLRNEYAWNYLSVKEILQLVEYYIEYAPTRIHKIRISEDGDIKSQEQLNFINILAAHLKKKYNIDTVLYTHRRLDFSGCKNLIINMSDEKLSGGDRYYLATDKKDWNKIKDGYDREKHTFKCHCDCRKCNFCYNTKEENGEDPNFPTRVYDVLRK